MKKHKYLIVIAGATAVGKTKMAIQLAADLKAEIFSADSRQFYREMSIGTAKPSAIELQSAEHHFIDNLSIQDEYSVGDYEKECLAALDIYFEKKKIAILCGGTGLYIKAICEGLDQFPKVPPSYRTALKEELENNGLSRLQEELKEKDPEYFSQADVHNPQRVIRALEIIRFTNRSFMSFWKKDMKERPFKVLKFALEMDRKKLYERINQRVDLMIVAGLVEEAKSLHPFKKKNALQTVGYKELFAHFDGEMGLDEAIELIKRNTRRYAKRQMTWFRNQGDYIAVPPNDFKPVRKSIKDLLNIDS